MSLTLYGLGPSRSFRCLWALEEANLDYDYVNLELSSTKEGGAKSPEYLGLNIQGKVPTLVHDDFVLTESAAILSYVNDLASQEFVPNLVEFSRWLFGDEERSPVVLDSRQIDKFAKVLLSAEGLSYLRGVKKPNLEHAFVIAGGVSCIPAAIAVWALVKPRVFAAYLGIAIAGSLIAGLVWGMLAI